MSSTSASALPPLTGERSIRLLRIKPNQCTETVECEVKTVASLDHVHEFDALSHVWGDPSKRTTIKVNNVDVPVRTKLVPILKHLRRTSDADGLSEDTWDESHPLHSSHNVWRSFSRNLHEHDSDFNPRSEWLWIDNLCINQEDIDELNSQVQIMREIYRSAKTVRIWFGEDDLTTTPLRPATALRRHLGAQMRHFGEYGSVPVLLVFIKQALRNNDAAGKRWYGQPTETMSSGWRHRYHGFLPPTAVEWSVPERFFTNEWFTRVWVIQEAAVSKVENAVIMLGEWEIKWWAVGKAAQWFEANSYSNIQVQNASTTWQITLQSTERVPLLTLLKTSRNRCASNPRDRVYAMLGLAKDISTAPGEPISQLIRPNYRKTEQEVFHDAAVHLLETDRTLSILSHCEYSITVANFSCPSWAPVWSNPQVSNPFPFNTSYAKCPFNADRGKERHIQISDKVIYLKGVSFDSVASSMTPFGVFRDNQKLYREERDHIVSIWDSVERTLKQVTPSYDREQAFQIFLSTLTAGVDNTGKDAELAMDFQPSAQMWVKTYFGDYDQVPSCDRVAMRHLGTIPAFQDACAHACKNRRMFVTHKGSIGLGPVGTQEGDRVVVLFGGKFPFILRSCDDAYVLIGDCYVHGKIMYGGVVMEWARNGSPDETFKIV